MKKIRFAIIMLCLLALLCSCAEGSVKGLVDDGDYVAKKKNGKDDSVVVEGDLEIHFLELGNKYTGDCTYVRAGENDILIDAGSKVSSIETIYQNT